MISVLYLCALFSLMLCRESDIYAAVTENASPISDQSAPRNQHYSGMMLYKAHVESVHVFLRSHCCSEISVKVCVFVHMYEPLCLVSHIQTKSAMKLLVQRPTEQRCQAHPGIITTLPSFPLYHSSFLYLSLSVSFMSNFVSLFHYLSLSLSLISVSLTVCLSVYNYLPVFLIISLSHYLYVTVCFSHFLFVW